MVALAKRGLLREGDVLEYRRTFPPPLGVTVEKDLLVRASAPRSLRAPLTFELCAAGHRSRGSTRTHTLSAPTSHISDNTLTTEAHPNNPR